MLFQRYVTATSGGNNGQGRQVTRLHVQENAVVAETEERTKATEVC